jgi:hypothetical protein
LSEQFGTKNDFGVTIVADRWLGIAEVTGSADVALYLVDQYLPKWRISVYGNHLTARKSPEGWRVQLQSPTKSKPDALGYRWPKYTGECFYAATLPLAILHALLAALIAKETP